MNTGPNKKIYRWKGKVCTEAVFKKRCAQVESGKKRRKCENESTSASNETSFSASTVEGCRIVDMNALVSHMRCICCANSLSLVNIEKEIRSGLASVFHVRCENCLLVNHVPTSEQHAHKKRKLYDVNSKVALGALHAGIGNTHVNKVLACLNIPHLDPHLFKRHEQEVGASIETVAKASCRLATASERVLTIENAEKLEKMLPTELQTGFIVPDKSTVTPETVVRLVASYDMGWSKRGTGRSYDSLNGYGAWIGYETKKVLEYGTRNRKCRMCDLGHSKDDHDCRMNYTGSAKNMENHLANELITTSEALRSSNCEIGVFIGDDDSSTIARLRNSSDHPIVKMSDINHTSKSVTKKLYNIQKEHKELTSVAIAYLHRCFAYAVAQNKGDSVALASAIRQIPYHAFNNHENCGDWCGWKKDKENYEHSTIPDGFSDEKLLKNLVTIFNKLADNSDKFAHGASSNPNENLNAMMASKAPKARCYSTSASSDYRFAATVANKNMGEAYIERSTTVLGISPGENTAKYIDSVTRYAETRATKVQSREFKNRRNVLKQHRALLRTRKETSEGTTYEAGMSLLDSCSTSSSNVDNNNNQPLPDSAHPCTDDSSIFEVVFFDLETAGLSKTAEILQIGALCKDESISVYVLPRQPIPLAASTVNGLMKINKELFLNGVRVTSHPLRVALEMFLKFLTQRNKPCVLAAHNASFDSVRLLNAINQTSMIEGFKGIIAGFADTLPIVRQLLNRRNNCKQTDLATEFLGISADGSHNALRDVEVLQMLAQRLKITNELLIEKMSTFESTIAKEDASKRMRKTIETLIPLKGVVSDGMTKKMALAGITFSAIVDAHTYNGADGIRTLLGDSVDGSPRVTKSSAVIDGLVNFIDECFDLLNAK